MTPLYHYITRGPKLPVRDAAIYATVGGLANAAILAILNTAAEQASQGADGQFWFLALFAVAILAFAFTQHRLYVVATTTADLVVDSYRTRVVRLIRRCDLHAVERLGHGRVYGALTRQPQTVTQVADRLIMAGQSIILIIFTLGYLAILSMWAVVLTFIVIGIAMAIYISKHAAVAASQKASEREENLLFETLTDIVDGFKEVRLHTARSHDVGETLEEVSGAVKRERRVSNDLFAQIVVLSQTTFYMLAGAMVFLLPAFGQEFSQDLLKTMVVSLFLIGPISLVVGAAAAVAMVTAACNDMNELEDELQKLAGRAATGATLPAFDEVRLERISFEHHDEAGQESFRLGPIDLTLKAGETLFISGGNGSGKSTLLRLLTALYRPVAGRILLDGRPLLTEEVEAYQSLFSTVFSDFHLFHRLYGMTGVDAATVDAMLRDVGLDRKVHFHDGRFDTLQLSTGQRKRLALVVALLERRPICIFDELAADQDPQFRRRFYEEFLPRLKAEGRTLVVVTHDDRYFGVGDRRIVMEEGRIADTVVDLSDHD